jgi:long-chain acyl-CoA synthetase
VVVGAVSLFDLLHRGLEANPDGAAVVSADTHWTWRELDDRTDRVAAGLLGLGLQPGDRVASLMPNRPR